MAQFVSPSKTWRRPGAGKTVWLELTLSVAIIGILNGLALREYAVYVARARYSVLLEAASFSRNAIVERYALSGEPYDMPGGQREVAVARSATEHMKRADIGFSDLLKSTSKALAAPFRPEDGATAGGSVSAVRTQGSAIVVRGRVEGPDKAEQELALTPLVQEAGVPQVVAWQCGKAMPEGWTGPTALVDKPVAVQWLPKLCREAASGAS